MKVYLAGGISGLSYEECVAWRQYAADHLSWYGIEALSPMRNKESLKDKGSVIFHDYPKEILSNQRAIMTRDRNDVINCDALLVNLLGSKTVSIGTMMELGLADLLRKPVIAVIEATGNPHDHPMVRESFGFRTESLDAGLATVVSVLCPIKGRTTTKKDGQEHPGPLQLVAA